MYSVVAVGNNWVELVLYGNSQHGRSTIAAHYLQQELARVETPHHEGDVPAQAMACLHPVSWQR